MKIAALSLRDSTDDLVAPPTRWTPRRCSSGTRSAVFWSSRSPRASEMADLSDADSAEAQRLLGEAR